MHKTYDVIVIGGGPGGMAAAVSACEKGCSVALLERDSTLGGILNQCIHNGFGLHRFKEELTGPEYAQRFVDTIDKLPIHVYCDTMVLSIDGEKHVHAVSPVYGDLQMEGKSIVLAMGCRERTAGAIGLYGTRPSGVFTAGTAQRYLNMEGYLVGKQVVILGSGDIGLIMARRMTLAGAKVKACVELMPFSAGLTRNIVQCLQDFDIPLYLSHTITKIEGKDRLSRVTVAKVDENRRPVKGSEFTIDCDTLLLSVGLIPENELTKGIHASMSPVTKGPTVSQTMETDVPGIFACGNVLHVHDLADYVTEEGERAGGFAASYAKGERPSYEEIRPIVPKGIATYTVPTHICGNGGQVTAMFRVRQKAEKGTVTVRCGDKLLASKKRMFMAPGEMEQITFATDDLPKDLPIEIQAEVTAE